MKNILSITTRSKSVYLFDLTNKRWERVNDTPGHEHILGFGENSGKLFSTPEPKIGERCLFWTGSEPYNWILTNVVDKIEEIVTQ
jgi:hypothetical protein